MKPADSLMQVVTRDGLECIIGPVVWPGDAVLFKGPGGDSLGWIIRRAQVRMLQDLSSSVCPDAARVCAEFTHAGCVLSADTFGELYRPRARTRFWRSVPAGTEMLFRRPRLPALVAAVTTWSDCERQYAQVEIAEACRNAFYRGDGYSLAELVRFYLWSWGLLKLGLGRRFGQVFVEEDRDSCASGYVTWAQAAGYMAGQRPESWYPARIAWDDTFFETVGHVKLVEG